MKKFCLVIAVLYLSIFINIKAQDYSYRTVNEIDATIDADDYMYEGGGYVIPSIGNFHILIIFAEFPDDNYDINNSRWKHGQAPTEMSKWVDQTWSTNPTQGSLTHYFNVMSGDRFHITGETMYVQAVHERSYYTSRNLTRGSIQRDILEQIDLTKDFSAFDNWQSTNIYSHNNQPDGQIDMVMFIWRNVNNGFSSSIENFTTNYGSIGYWKNNGIRYERMVYPLVWTEKGYNLMCKV